MKKGDILQGTVYDTSFPNKGKIKIEDKNVSVKGVIKGQEVLFRLKRNGAEKAEGELKEVLKPSPEETAGPACPAFGECGGCFLQTVPYEKQLAMKEYHIKKLLAPVIRNKDVEFLPIKGSPLPYGYRNKVEFSFGNSYKDGPMLLGFHRKNSMFDIVSGTDCALVHEDVRAIAKAAERFAVNSGLDFFHRTTGTGFFRHVLIRRAQKSGEILVNVIHTTQVECDFTRLVEELLALPLQGKIVGILHTKNDTIADAIKDDGTEVLYGNDRITEELLGLTFEISTFSFFQTNSLGAEVLYSTVRDMVGETRDKVIFDLYSGTGTIGQMLAPVAKKVIGIEIIAEAVEAAKDNAKRNGLSNCEFLTGDVLKKLDEISEKPDFIVLDPPREGVVPKALQKIIDYGVNGMVYISCKPTSLANDLEALQDAGYRVVRVQTVDLFPQTPHVETVVGLQRTNT
ncbi:MAG: 23S rRNA (uracil(1939)-C(5))-methyltransferase RlmD [Lachnospiraceae bacterium]|nr:23S rRNA (uracil(1939)-C(5))-methyltransferase RlmD [Lachnospiraceae bacterium]